MPNSPIGSRSREATVGEESEGRVTFHAYVLALLPDGEVPAADAEQHVLEERRARH